jgi:predicted RNase H-like nuclease
MTRVAGVDGTPKGWAVVIAGAGQPVVRRVRALVDIFDDTPFDIVAVDVPIGLLDAYEIGGRACDRAARKLLGPRGSSVFAAPVRAVLEANSWDEGCKLSRASSRCGKAISKQTYAIVDKIREVDRLLQTRPELRRVVREVHPEVCFCQLVGKPMTHSKGKSAGREERRAALGRALPQLDTIVNAGRALGLPIEDILDATVACWSALRLAAEQGRSLPALVVPSDATGLPMAIWV